MNDIEKVEYKQSCDFRNRIGNIHVLMPYLIEFYVLAYTLNHAINNVYCGQVMS